MPHGSYRRIAAFWFRHGKTMDVAEHDLHTLCRSHHDAAMGFDHSSPVVHAAASVPLPYQNIITYLLKWSFNSLKAL